MTMTRVLAEDRGDRVVFTIRQPSGASHEVEVVNSSPGRRWCSYVAITTEGGVAECGIEYLDAEE